MVKCPTCRQPIGQIPVYSFIVRQVVEAIATTEGVEAPGRPRSQRFNWYSHIPGSR